MKTIIELDEYLDLSKLGLVNQEFIDNVKNMTLLIVTVWTFYI